MRKLAAAATMLALGVTLAGPVLAHGDESHEKRFAESQQRHDIMHRGKEALGKIVKHIKGEGSEDDDIAALAEIIAQSAAESKASFEKDTRGMAGKTEARPEIWENWEDFASRMDSFAADARAFADTAKAGGDIAGGLGKLTRNCKSCHDKYKD
ncbi:MAG: cytochrome c [Alphaproteobacteria bacterium]|nr:MAG: cytochrome c [Alphaproteobacteria bacterium]